MYTCRCEMCKEWRNRNEKAERAVGDPGMDSFHADAFEISITEMGEKIREAIAPTRGLAERLAETAKEMEARAKEAPLASEIESWGPGSAPPLARKPIPEPWPPPPTSVLTTGTVPTVMGVMGSGAYIVDDFHTETVPSAFNPFCLSVGPDLDLDFQDFERFNAEGMDLGLFIHIAGIPVSGSSHHIFCPITGQKIGIDEMIHRYGHA